jgi:AbrB family looped-hinge helix DNA binding protein
MIIDILDEAERLGFELEVRDKGCYWETRSVQVLLDEVGQMNRLMTPFADVKAMVGEMPRENPQQPLWNTSTGDYLMERHTITPSIEDPLNTVTISPKFQVVIPRAIREQLGLQPGQKVQAIAYEDRIEFIPVRSMKSMRGFLKGITTTVSRDRDRV